MSDKMWLPSSWWSTLAAGRPNSPPTGQTADTGWAALTWTDLDAAVGEGAASAHDRQLRLLRGRLFSGCQPVVSGSLATGLTRANITLLLAGTAQARGSYEHRATSPDGYMVSRRALLGCVHDFCLTV